MESIDKFKRIGNAEIASGNNRDVQRDRQERIPDSRVGGTGDENLRVFGMPRA